MADQGLSSPDDSDWNQADELVVATEHVGFVLEHLGNVQKLEHHPWLGLSRLLLSTRDAAARLEGEVDATRGARQVQQSLAEQAEAISTAVLGPADASDRDAGSGDPMSTVLADLRALAVVLHGGWTPTIGRNRLVELPGTGSLAVTSKTSYGKSRAAGTVNADSKTSYGGSGAPTRISGGSWAPPGPRAAGPGSGVRVGLVDTRLWSHPWLSGGWVARATDLLPADRELTSVAGHGTFVAGLVLSQAPGATLVVRSGLDELGQGTTWRVAAAIADLAQSGVSVINLSFAAYTADGQPPLVLARAVDRVDADVLVVAAAGNHAGLGQDGEDDADQLARFGALPSWPAALDDVVAVGSLDALGRRTASFSPKRPWVDVAVRGENLRSTFIPQDVTRSMPRAGDWAEWSGTSFSAALLSGAVAAGTEPGGVSPREALANLVSTADSPARGGGRATSGPRRLRLPQLSWPHGSPDASG